MGRLDIIIPDDLDREFRVRVAQTLGGERGALSKATADAIRLWLRQKEPAAKKK